MLHRRLVGFVASPLLVNHERLLKDYRKNTTTNHHTNQQVNKKLERFLAGIQLYLVLRIYDLTRIWVCCKYSSSTLLRAHGVLRKNFKLDLMLGSCVKQRTGTAAAIASQPMLPDSRVTIISRVMPSRFGRCTGFLLVSMHGFYRGWQDLSVYNTAS